MRPRRTLVPMAALLVGWSLGACETTPVTPEALSLQGIVSPEISQDANRSLGREFPALERVGLNAVARGPFVPGNPIMIEVTATANRDAHSAVVEIRGVNLDRSGLRARRTTALESWSGDLPKGGTRIQRATIAFPEPGYYRVDVVARTEAPEEASVRISRTDSAVVGFSRRVVWILVTEEGGRMTQGFDPRVIEEHGLPFFGSYGPFRTGEARHRLGPVGPDSIGSYSFLAVKGRSRDSSEPPPPHSGPWAGSGSEIALVGTVEYNNYDVSPATQDPVAGAEVEVDCFGKSEWWMVEYDLWYRTHTRTDGNGDFVAICDSGYEYIEGYARLRNDSVYVSGADNTTSGVFFSGYDNDTVQLMVANDYAAHVFKTMKHWIPRVAPQFGQSRDRGYYEVSETDPDWGNYYVPNTDEIHLNYTRVLGNDGLFVALHEYGHAYQHEAIEPWREYSYSGDGHSWLEEEYHSCAFVEGFANFLSMWILGSALTTVPYGADYGLENNLYGSTPTNSFDGVRVESAVAAFLYDLVDGTDELDSSTNTADGDDDDLQVPASWLANVMDYCVLGSYSRLAGADELVYCLERSVSAYAVGDSLGDWRSRTWGSWEQSLTVYGQDTIRAMWLQSFYGVS